MSLCWQRETYTIVYNGEIYNADEIRRLLTKLGHQFSGHSDTEVVLHAYAQWAENAVERLNGIFAFAVWEHKQKKLFLARDRIGVKPLFYALHREGLIFASEIKTILTYPGFKSQIDGGGVAEVVLLGPGRTPGCGVFYGIDELEPGCCGYYHWGKWNWKRYWKLIDRPHLENFEETAEVIRFLVTDSIRRQMVSDVPVGTFLSGGLDSSIISAVCAEEMKKQGKTLQTFSVDYAFNDKYFEAGKFQPSSDSTYIKIMVDALNTEQHFTLLDSEALADNIETATIARDLPGMADVDISLLLFC
jgi:asparagine synthase (glutamine-hydrolysing)